MKKILTLFLIFLAVKTQAIQTIPFIYIFYFAFGSAFINGNDSWKDPVGLQVAIEAKFLEINDNSSISTGIGFSKQGAGWEESELSGRVNLYYLNIPIMYRYTSDKGIYGEIGLQPQILLSAKDKYNGITEDYKYGVKSFDLGLPVGAGYQINEQLSVGARVTYGLTNLDNLGSEISDHNVLVVAVIAYSLGNKSQ